MKKVKFFIGTRPEAVKLCPIINEFKSRPEVKASVILTGQHRKACLDALGYFGVEADGMLPYDAEGLSDSVQMLMRSASEEIDREKPSLVVVQGDTASAYAVAMTAFSRGVPVAHVEAGLRSLSPVDPFPEEYFRRAIDSTATLLFAPGEREKHNLLRENISEDRIFTVGNTILDSFERLQRENSEADKSREKRVLLTLHRRETVLPKVAEAVLRGIKRATEEYGNCSFVFPIHPNPLIEETARRVLGECGKFSLVPPMGIGEFRNALCSADIVLTDSGGVQEEAAILSKPCLVIREHTERPLFGAILSGTTEEGVRSSLFGLLSGMQTERMPDENELASYFGNGDASKRITEEIIRFLSV